MDGSPVTFLIREALLYAVMSAFLLCVDVALLWILVHFFSWPYLRAATMSFGVGYFGEHHLTAKRGAAFLTFVWNFAARRQLLFVHSPRSHSSDQWA